MSHQVEQAVRLSHCAHPYADKHPCEGKCIITPEGVELACHICGDHTDSIRSTCEYKKLTRILNKIGVDSNIISITTINSMLLEMKT